MPSQDDGRLPFSIANDLTNFRLLELPEELLAILTLSLKSESDSSTAVICTHSKSFPIRQVHTSNTLFVAHSALLRPATEDDIPTDGVRAIASCAATLELYTFNDSAIPYLRKLLPVYSSLESLAAIFTGPAYPSLSAVSNEVPLSHGEIAQGWIQICAFAKDGNCFRPTAASLLQVWKAMVSASVAEDIPLNSTFLVDDLWKATKDSEFPRALLDAILARIADNDTMEDGDNSKWCSIDTTKCISWVATLLLETLTRADQTIAVNNFLEPWRDHLLEDWRHLAKLEVIQHLCNQPSPSTIGIKPELRLSAPPKVFEQIAADKAPTKARKWHEKFKKGRT
ncbi:ATP-dependent RNA helicase [Venturia nashicola]|uniref:ATP-dependent RNA helicase n=1 Tax=Venturia nashicola TaxID=86259 RepID=A0A4Z1PSL1_9PEZI|nr:ATP-dependent RNA helicase [Venturia nashicola]